MIRLQYINENHYNRLLSRGAPPARAPAPAPVRPPARAPARSQVNFSRPAASKVRPAARVTPLCASAHTRASRTQKPRATSKPAPPKQGRGNRFEPLSPELTPDEMSGDEFEEEATPHLGLHPGLCPT